MEAEEKNPRLYLQYMAEFAATWKASDANKDGLLNCKEFKTFMTKHNDNMKRHWGESTKGNAKEDERWYAAYNMLTPDCEGVSMEEFKCAKDIIRRIVCVKMFEPLLKCEMERMKKYSKSVQDKMMDAWTSEDKNPTLFAEMMDEFSNTFKAADADKDNMLCESEFKIFFTQN